jgi:hypothetical protein
MEQGNEKPRGPTAQDVIKSGSFLARMDNWKSLAAAVSKPSFDTHMAAFEKWIEREFTRLRVQPGNYDELARKLASAGLARGENESAKDYCQRTFLRRPALNKPLDKAFRPPGRPPRKRLR